MIHMFKRIVIPVDNSSHSRIAEKLGIRIAKNCSSEITGLHVFSGRFHQFRFKVLEDYLPERYQKEEILEYQRNIHSVLIERGLELISTEYLKDLSDYCKAENIDFHEEIIDGKNSDVIIEESKNHDLLIIGAQGLGKIQDSNQLGTNTRRAVEYATSDMLIAKKDATFDRIYVGIDGSDYSRNMFRKIIDFAQLFNSEITLLSSFDPFLHQTVFSSLVNVLSEEAGNVFKFKEQEELHTDVIDKSLEGLYLQYLKGLEDIGKQHGIKVRSKLLQGKPYWSIQQKIIDDKPDLIVVSRYGMHKGTYEHIGSNSLTIAEKAPSNVLIINSSSEDQYSFNEPSRFSEAIPNNVVTWSDEAKKRLENIPSFARPMAVLAIERYAKEIGCRVITPEIMKKARDKSGA